MKFLTALLAIGAAACLNSTSSAMLVFEDDFSYSDGNLVPNGGWSAHSGAGSNSVQVSGGAINLTHGGSSREDVSVNLGIGNIVQGVLTYTFDLTVTDTAISGTDFEYFAHFSDGGTSAFFGRLDVVAPSGSGDYGLGISHNSSTAEATTTSDFDFGSPIAVSVTYDFQDQQASLTVGSETIQSSVGTAPDLLTHMAFRQSNSSSDETLTVDNLQVFYTVPEPSAFLFGGLVCTVMAVSTGRKRDR
ncbi:MAG: hypothetical protein AAGD11_00770 [Planctomycetota bacterium]